MRLKLRPIVEDQVETMTACYIHGLLEVLFCRSRENMYRWKLFLDLFLNIQLVQSHHDGFYLDYLTENVYCDS